MVTRPSADHLPAAPADVIEEMRRRYNLLTQSQKRIADFIAEQSDAVAFLTVDQMALRLGVNASTVVRFCYRLGLSGFPDLQDRLRTALRGQLAPTAGRKPTHLTGTAFGASLARDMANLERTLRGLTRDGLDRAVTALTGARRVYVVAGFSAFSVAHCFGLELSRLRPDVHTIETGDGVSTVRLAEMGTADCMVAFTFPRYARFTQRAAAFARERSSTLLVVTDTPVSPAGQIADTVLVACPGGTGVQNSMVAPMAVANALINGWIAATGAAALDRYRGSNGLFDTLNATKPRLDSGD
jgi:DNA-binding MurR/RpiR family transcriptional regulator